MKMSAPGMSRSSWNTSSPGRLYRPLVMMVCVAISIGPLLAQQAASIAQPAGVADDPSEPAFVQVPEDPHLPRVLIMGDSISMGYTLEVRKLLAGRANAQHPNVNCGPSGFGVEHASQWIAGKHWDVIYFNFGLHDLKYLDDKGRYVTPDKGKQVASIEQYQANLKALVATLQSTGAKLIFATTTPVPSGSSGRVEGDEIRYNAAAGEIMQKMRIPVDDLWRLVKPALATLQQPHNVHFTAEGYRVLGAEVASRIGRELPVSGRP